jgi:hypothetical protein
VCGIQAVVALLKSGELVVAFRPTEASSLDKEVMKSDWATDADIKLVVPSEMHGVTIPAEGENWRVSAALTAGGQWN